MTRSRRQDGFALPMTLFLISIVTLMLTAAFAKVQSDRRVAESSGANVNALAIARAGLHQYMGTRPFNSPGSVASPWRPPGGDSIRITLTGGYADVIARVVRKPADTLANWLYVIRSVGHVIEPTQGADPQAVRTIAQFAQWQTGRMDVAAAFTAANLMNAVNGGNYSDIEVEGYNECGCAPDVAGLRAPTGSDALSTSAPGGSATDWHWSGGSPLNNVTGTKAAVALGTNIDWFAIVNGAFTPDHTAIQNSGPDQWQFTSQLINGNANLSGDGSGLLIVTGDLTVTSGGTWEGVVLVGGTLTFNSNHDFHGAVMSGLAQGLATPPTAVATNLGSEDITIRYHSQFVSLSLAKLTGFAPITNGWVDNWATY